MDVGHGPQQNLFGVTWQKLHLAEISSSNSNETQKRADIIRSQLSQVQFARASGIISDEGANHLQLRKFADYAAVVDSPEESQGLNNYADYVVSQLNRSRPNESQLWKSSLQVDQLFSMPCITQLQKRSLKSHQQLLQNGTDKIKMPAVNSLMQQSVDGVPMSFMRPDTYHDTNPSKSFIPQPDSVDCGVPPFSSKLDAPLVPDTRNMVQNSRVTLSSKKVLGRPCDIADDEILSGCGKKRLYDVRNGPQSMKENERYSVDSSLGDGASNSAFLTARQQLDINDQKKFGRSRNGANPPGSTSPTYSYGSAKRSLGARRGPGSKFVPPVIGRSSDDGERTGQRNSGGSKQGPSSVDESNVDPRLKNFEPRMLELITSEIMDHGPPVKWDDIAGLEFVKKTIKEIIIWPMLRPDIFTGLRGPPKGLLLFGPPGTGKTLIGKCIASQSKSTFFSISASSLTSKWVGEGEKMVRALFAVARVNQPSVVFIDEIDSLLSQRSDSEHESSRRIKTEFLVQLDGATTGDDDRILVVGATNRPQEIDEAARRRFVKRLYIPLPENEARKRIVQLLMSQQSNCLTPTDLDTICCKTDGYSGADMANLCREAALGPIRSLSFADIENISADEVRPINLDDFMAALRQVRASVSDRDLDLYTDWNRQYGSFGVM